MSLGITCVKAVYWQWVVRVQTYLVVPTLAFIRRCMGTNARLIPSLYTVFPKQFAHNCSSIPSVFSYLYTLYTAPIKTTTN